MLYLRQSTAGQTLLIGPFVDDTDGAAVENGLSIANTDIRLSKNGAAAVAKNSGGATIDSNGWYATTLDAADTSAVGRLQLHCAKSGALMVHHEFTVLEEAVYDALYADAATGLLPANVTQWNATALSSTDPIADLVAALFTDAQAEPTGTPGATLAPMVKLATLYMMARNQKTVTATKKTYHDAGGSAEFEADLSDNGSTYTESAVNGI